MHMIEDPTRTLEQAKRGDLNALSSLLDAYRNYLSLLARLHVDRHLQAKLDPSDLVQETCFQAYRAFGGFRGTTEPELTSWLRRILAAKAVSAARRYRGTQRRDVHLEVQVENELHRSSQGLGHIPVSPHTTPTQAAARREASVILADALARLPENYREALILYHLEGLAIAEIARRMARSVDSVKKLLARGLLRMRRDMKDLI